MSSIVVNDLSTSQTYVDVREIIVEATDHINYVDRVGVNYERSITSQDIPSNELNNVIDELKTEYISLPHPNSLSVSDLNTIHVQPFKESSKVNINFNEYSLDFEFEAALSNLKKADPTYDVNEQNLSLNFGKLNADVTCNCNLNNMHDNNDEDQDSIELETTKLALNNNDQKVIENIIVDAGIRCDDSLELINNIETKNGLTKDTFIEKKEIEAITQNSETNTIKRDDKDVLKTNTELIKKIDKGNTMDIDYSLKGLDTQSDYNKNHLDRNEKDSERCIELIKTEENFNNNKNHTVFIQLDSSNDGNNSAELKNKSSIAELDIISISSTGDNIFNADKLDNDSYCSGYDSSDFEFITESEAKLAGIISKSATKERDTFKTGYIAKDVIFAPRCGPSKNIETAEKFFDSPRTSYARNKNMNTCEVPQGDDYLNLFRSINNPVLPLSDICYLENKSAKTITMDVDIGDVGYNIRRTRSITDDELKQDAMETRRKIISTYSRFKRKHSYLFRNKQK